VARVYRAGQDSVNELPHASHVPFPVDFACGRRAYNLVCVSTGREYAPWTA